jgi:hypothetical protein
MSSGQAKRRRTPEERAAEEAAKRARAAGAAPDEPWALEARQPWADKAVPAARPTAEQLEWLEKEGFLKDKEAEGAEGEARAPLRAPPPRPRRRLAAPYCEAAGSLPAAVLCCRRALCTMWRSPPRLRARCRPQCPRGLPFSRGPRRARAAQDGAKAAPAAPKIPEKSMFHGKALVDGAGRSWLEPPRDRKLRRPDGDYCFLPKRWIHTWAGHTKGVNAIRFFPGTGHLLLSAGLDGKVKIWDVFGSGKCMRTYLGFSKARAAPPRAPGLRACAARVLHA